MFSDNFKMKKLLLTIILGMFLISFTSAVDWDNIKDVNYNKMSLKYPEITIKNSLLWVIPLDPILNIKLTTHTPKCLNGLCKSEQTFINYENVSPVEDIKFIDGYGKELTDISYNIYTYEKEIYQEEVIDKEKTKLICGEDILNENGSISNDCYYDLVYKTIEKTREVKVEYIFGEKNIGKKIVGIDVDIKNYSYVDYIFKSAGVWTDELAAFTPADCSATGGNIVIVDDNFCVHTFLSNSTLNVSTEITNATILVLAGGGGGGAGNGGGGGGGSGGIQINASFNLTIQDYSVIIGGGGTGSSSTPSTGDNGGNSVFSIITAVGGGGGGTAVNGADGGSGGGGGITSKPGGTGSQGGDGGTGTAGGGGGGGGGTATNGDNGAGNDGGDGGAGTTSTINGSSINYGGGGGGGRSGGGTPGSGTDGGGDGGSPVGVNGLSNSGSGGGGGSDGIDAGGNGGSGKVIIKYAISGVPIVNLISPVQGLNSSNTSISFSCNSTSNLGILNISLIIDEVFNQTNFNSTSLQNLSLSSDLSLSQGNHNWTCQACDETFCTTELIRNFTIDSVFPQINLDEPRGEIDFFLIGSNLTINWTVSDTNLESCFFSYNNTNTSVVCAANNFSFTPVIEISNLTFFANDSFGNLGSNFSSWTYKILEINQTFNNQTIEGATEIFNINIQTSGTQISTASLVYNNTFNTATFENLGNNIFSISKNLIIPNVPSESNLTFFWNIILSDDSNINSSINNQTVKIISLDNCTSNPNQIFNFTVLDEELQTIIINATTEVAINILSLDRSTLVSNISLTSLVNPTQICLNLNLTSGTNYSLDSVIKYESGDHAIEYYNIDNFNLNQVSSFQNINLFDLNLSDSTEFKITFKDVSFSPVENALVLINRQYVSEDVFKTVEIPKTDSNSETVGHFVRNDVVYNIIFIKDGEVIGNFENIRVFCDDFTIGDCILSLEAKAGLTIPFEFDENSGLIFSSEPTFDNETKIMSFTYVTTSGSTETVSMTVERNDVFGNKTLCEDSLTSASGTLSCTVPSTIDDTLLVTTVNLGNNTALITNTEINRSDWGSIGYLAWFLLSLVLVFAFGDDKTNVFMAMLFSYIGAFTIGFIDRTLFSVGAAGTWLIAITIIGIWQLNKGNPQ